MRTSSSSSKHNRFTLVIGIGLLAGIAMELLLHASYLAEDNALRLTIEQLELLGELFLRLIKMIIAPLVFTTVVVGVAKLGDSTAAWFLSASFVSLVLGLIMVNLLKPGAVLQLPLSDL